jgi:hypothetical protein
VRTICLSSQLPQRNKRSGRCAGSSAPEAELIRIAITGEALETIEALVTEGDTLAQRLPTADGKFFVWLEGQLVDALGDLRGPGEDYSDVMLRLAPIEQRRPA